MGAVCQQAIGPGGRIGSGMTPEASEFFRSMIRLYDYSYLDHEDAVSAFDLCTAVAAWAHSRSGAFDPSLDRYFEVARNSDPGRLIGLLSFLATIDVHFFELLKRMVARDLSRRPPSEQIRTIAASLLVQEPPSTSRPTLARNVAIVLGIAVSREFGVLPYESMNLESGGPPRSGCGKVLAAMDDLGASMTYDAVERVWKHRSDVLQGAGFHQNVVSDFFEKLVR